MSTNDQPKKQSFIYEVIIKYNAHQITLSRYIITPVVERPKRILRSLHRDTKQNKDI